MTQYIDKAAVVAEIEDKIKKYTLRGEESDFLQDGNAKYWGGVLSCLNEVKTLIDTLEVKEVDLEKEVKNFTEDLFHNAFNEDKSQDHFWNDISTVIEYTAKHFFELGMAVRNKAQKGGQK